MCEQHVDDRLQRELPFGILATGHSNRAVPQQLVGDIHAGRDSGLDGQLPRVEERAIAQVLEDVVGLYEVAHADPLGALVTHAGQAGDVANSFWIHEQGHGVAANTGADDCPVGHLGAAVVGAAGTEER